MIEEANKKTPVAYSELARVVESRQAVYLIRANGSADILPKRFVNDDELKAHLQVPWLGSSFL